MLITLIAFLYFEVWAQEPREPGMFKNAHTHYVFVTVACEMPAEEPDADEPEDITAESTPTRTFEATAYTARCDGCTGITASGYDVRDTIYAPDGVRVIATDPEVIPTGTLVEVTLDSGKTFEARALDVGGAIKGARVDVLKATKAEAREFGRQDVEIRIIEEGTE